MYEQYNVPILHVGGPLDAHVQSGPVHKLTGAHYANIPRGCRHLVPIPGTQPRQFYPGEYVDANAEEVGVPADQYARIFRWIAHNRGDD